MLLKGYDDIIIETNEYNSADTNVEMKKLEGLILSMIKKNEGRLAKENNWKGEEMIDRFGVPLTKSKK